MEKDDAIYQKSDFQKFQILDHLQILKENEFDYVYRPNDDTYFFLKVLFLEAKHIQQPEIILEIGTGSGMLITHFTQWLTLNNKQPTLSLGTDINIDACYLSDRFAKKHGQTIEFFNTNIASGLTGRIGNQTDIIICNPPYVPTSQEELQKAYLYIKEKDQLIKTNQQNKANNVNCIDVSYAGGLNGMDITYKILKEADKLLKKGGWIYLFLIQENKIQKVIEYQNNQNYKAEILAKQLIHDEMQYIIKFKKL